MSTPLILPLYTEGVADEDYPSNHPIETLRRVLQLSRFYPDVNLSGIQRVNKTKTDVKRATAFIEEKLWPKDHKGKKISLSWLQKVVKVNSSSLAPVDSVVPLRAETSNTATVEQRSTRERSQTDTRSTNAKVTAASESTTVKEPVLPVQVSTSSPSDTTSVLSPSLASVASHASPRNGNTRASSSRASGQVRQSGKKRQREEHHGDQQEQAELEDQGQDREQAQDDHEMDIQVPAQDAFEARLLGERVYDMATKWLAGLEGQRRAVATQKDELNEEYETVKATKMEMEKEIEETKVARLALIAAMDSMKQTVTDEQKKAWLASAEAREKFQGLLTAQRSEEMIKSLKEAEERLTTQHKEGIRNKDEELAQKDREIAVLKGEKVQATKGENDAKQNLLKATSRFETEKIEMQKIIESKVNAIDNLEKELSRLKNELVVSTPPAGSRGKNESSTGHTGSCD
jgi:hypothetical protein